MIDEQVIKTFNLLMNEIEIRVNDNSVNDALDENELSESDVSFNDGWQSGALFVLQTLREEIELWRK